MEFLFWVLVIAVGVFCALEYRDHRKNRSLWDEIERYLDDSDNDRD
jgi:hypothetical protein